MLSLPMELFGFQVEDGADALAADLEDAVGGADGVDDFGAVGVDVDHGFFEVDVLAGFEGVDGGLFVPVVGGGDEDGVDVLAGEDLAVVAGGEEVGAPELFGVGEAAVVAVGGGDQLDAGNLQGEFGVALALNAGADEGELDVVVGGARRGGGGLGEERMDAAGGSGDGGGLYGGLEEVSAIKHGRGRLAFVRGVEAKGLNVYGRTVRQWESDVQRGTVGDARRWG